MAAGHTRLKPFVAVIASRRTKHVSLPGTRRPSLGLGRRVARRRRVPGMATVMRLFGQIQNLPRVKVTVLRNGQKLTFVLTTK